MTDIQALSKRFAELAGICWHEQFYEVQPYVEYNQDQIVACGKCHKPDPPINPDFTDAREVLKVMRAGEDWESFVYHIGGNTTWNSSEDILHFYIPVNLILDTTGLLLSGAVDFMEGRK